MEHALLYWSLSVIADVMIDNYVHGVIEKVQTELQQDIASILARGSRLHTTCKYILLRNWPPVLC